MSVHPAADTLLPAGPILTRSRPTDRPPLRLIVTRPPSGRPGRAEEVAALSWAWRAAIREGRPDLARDLFWAYLDLTKQAPR